MEDKSLQRYTSTQFGSKIEALMAKLLGTMQTSPQQQSNGQSELNTTLEAMGKSLTFLKEVVSASYLNAASDSTDKMSESEISQEGDDLSDNITQTLAAKTSVKTRQTKMKYLIGCIYRAPHESLEVFDYLNNVMKHATNNSLEVIVIGDLNCDINSTSRQTERLLECTMANKLEQLIREPTHVTSTTCTLTDVLIISMVV